MKKFTYIYFFYVLHRWQGAFVPSSCLIYRRSAPAWRIFGSRIY